ncbi:Acyl-CoA hydrolase protein [Dioscorea alata]|uniref:Acyl-CoA hydrolase protein n=1 Tax=Dioscorea alata TaxID=55571 RepID=A0ACB7UD86_DIOAL|nr:Acyl-CoA hydrolase protein [Dioscorea alata]
MGEGEGDSKGTAAKRWLESVVAKPRSQVSSTSRVVGDGGFFNALTLWDLRVSLTHAGRALCSFRVPPHLTDSDGNWIPGAMSTVIDLVGAAAILSEEGELRVSADMDITYLSPAKIDDEVEVDARVLGHKGRVSAVLVELRKKRNGERVALGKLWMASGRPLIKSSKL